MAERRRVAEQKNGRAELLPGLDKLEGELQPKRHGASRARAREATASDAGQGEARVRREGARVSAKEATASDGGEGEARVTRGGARVRAGEATASDGGARGSWGEAWGS